MEYESDVSDSEYGVDDPERDPKTFYLEGKLAFELPNDDTQPSAALYRAVCGGDLSTVKSLLATGHYPNVPYYYIPKKKLASYFRIYLGESIEDERGMFHYPLHRPVLLNDVELVVSLLDHGADPNVLDGRSNTPFKTVIMTERPVDSLIVEKLILSGVDKDAALSMACDRYSSQIKWSVVKTLLCHGADMKKLLCSGDDTFLHVVSRCGWKSVKDHEVGYEILEKCLDCGLDDDLLQKAVVQLVFSYRCEEKADTLVFLLQAGVPVDFPVPEMRYPDSRYYEPGYTPLQIMFKELGDRLNELVQHSKCRGYRSDMLCTDFTFVWLLVKAGAQLRSYKGDNICERLVLMELTLNTIYDKTERATRDTWPSRQRSYVLGQLQHCKEVIAWLSAAHPQSLFELSAVAVRRSLGLFPGRTVTKLGLPMNCQDAVLLQDLQTFVTKMVQCLHPPRGDRSPLHSDSYSDEVLSFSDESENN